MLRLKGEIEIYKLVGFVDYDMIEREYKGHTLKVDCEDKSCERWIDGEKQNLLVCSQADSNEEAIERAFESLKTKVDTKLLEDGLELTLRSIEGFEKEEGKTGFFTSEERAEEYDGPNKGRRYRYYAKDGLIQESRLYTAPYKGGTTMWGQTDTTFETVDEFTDYLESTYNISF